MYTQVVAKKYRRLYNETLAELKMLKEAREKAASSGENVSTDVKAQLALVSREKTEFASKVECVRVLCVLLCVLCVYCVLCIYMGVYA